MTASMRNPVHEQLARDWLAAWNAHDLDRILDHYADEVEFHSPFVVRLMGGGDGVVRGRQALRDYFARGLQAYPTLHFEWIRIYSGAESCVLEYRSVHGLRAAEVLEFNAAGKIRRVLAHYDDAFPQASGIAPSQPPRS
jgi:ketosteroid isomerase-like protein